MSPSVSSYWDSVWAVRQVYLGPCWLYSDLWWWFSYWNGFAFLNLWCSFRMLCRCLALAFRYLGKSSACPLPTLNLAKVFRWRFGWWGRRSIESRAARDLIESLQVKLNCNKIFGLHCRGLAGQCILTVNQLQLMYKDGQQWLLLAEPVHRWTTVTRDRWWSYTILCAPLLRSRNAHRFGVCHSSWTLYQPHALVWDYSFCGGKTPMQLCCQDWQRTNTESALGKVHPTSFHWHHWRLEELFMALRQSSNKSASAFDNAIAQCTTSLQLWSLSSPISDPRRTLDILHQNSDRLSRP